MKLPYLGPDEVAVLDSKQFSGDFVRHLQIEYHPRGPYIMDYDTEDGRRRFRPTMPVTAELLFVWWAKLSKAQRHCYNERVASPPARAWCKGHRCSKPIHGKKKIIRHRRKTQTA